MEIRKEKIKGLFHKWTLRGISSGEDNERVKIMKRQPLYAISPFSFSPLMRMPPAVSMHNTSGHALSITLLSLNNLREGSQRRRKLPCALFSLVARLCLPAER